MCGTWLSAHGFSWERAAAVIYPVISGNSPFPKNVVSLKLLSEAALVSQRGEVGHRTSCGFCASLLYWSFKLRC